MSSNEMENEIDNEVPAKRMKWDGKKNSPQARSHLSQILQREIDTEIQLRSCDLETIEENIFLTKQCLLKLRQGVVSDYYKQKTKKDSLQYSHHPAVQDTIIGKSPKAYTQLECPTPGTSALSDGSPEKQERRKKCGRKSSLDKKATPTKELKPPCHIQPKPFNVETVKPPEPRGVISKKQIRIVVGNVSKWLAPEEAASATHKWTVYTKSNDVDLCSIVSKVVFFLHPSYKPNDVVPIVGSPFKLTRRGWGEFPLKARFHFKNPLDTPVDVVHVLKLDNKHTGFETFGAETTLAVWIHVPSTDNSESPISEHFVTSQVLDNTGSITIKQEEDQKLVFEETFNNYIKKEKENESHSLNKIYSTTEFNEQNHLVIGNFSSNKSNTNFIKEVLNPEVVVIDKDIIEGDSNLISYDNCAVNNRSTDSLNDGLDYLIKQEENAELNQLSSSFIEEVIKAGFIFDEFTSIGNEKLCSENNVEQLVVDTTKDEDKIIHIKTEPQSDEYTEKQVCHSQQNLDDYLDECNVVGSEVVIDCDADSPTTYENTEKPEEDKSLIKQENICNSNTISCASYQNSLVTPVASPLGEKLLKSDLPKLLSDKSVTNYVIQNNSVSPMKIVDISSLLKNKNTITLKSGISQNHSLQNLTKEFVQPSVSKVLKTDNSKINQVISNHAVGQIFKIITSPEKPVKPVISGKAEQLNSIEITDNGKTLAAGMVPVVKVSDCAPYMKSIPRKVYVRKLNGEVSTFIAPISQELLSKTLQLTASQTRAQVNNAKNDVSGAQPLKQNHDNLSNTYVVSKNLGTFCNVGKIQNLSMANQVNNITLQKNITTSITNSTQSSSSSVPVSEINKPKRKYKTNKEVKSTLIMLQKENGEVILKKEAKFSDIKEEANSSSLKKVSKVSLEGTTVSRNKQGNGKKMTGALENMSVLPYNKCQTSNMNPSLIELQQPMCSKSSFPTHTPHILQGQRKSSKNNNMKQKYVNALQKSNLLETKTAVKLAPNNYNGLDTSILLKCPTLSTEAAVKWLVKIFPLVDTRAIIPGFRTKRPYCAKSREEFLSWPYGKQRAAEWTRSKLVFKYLNKLEKIDKKWTTLQIYDWARIRAFTPMEVNTEIETSLDSTEEPFFYSQPTSEIIEYIKKCKDLKENESVDVVSIDVPTKSTKSGISFVSSRDKEFKFNLPSVEKKSLFEPELAGLKKFVNSCQSNVGAESCPEIIVPGISYSAADRMLISAFHSFAEDLIRRSYSASWVRHANRAPGVIESEDVNMALLSRSEMDFLIASKVEKKERPPVTLLPNIS